MRICGVHARVSGGRHRVGLAAIDTVTSTCVGHFVWLAPAGESAAGQLHELYVRAHELLERSSIEMLVAWTTDPAPGGGGGQRAQLIDASRAEGAVMAAAGAVPGVARVEKASGAAVRAEGGSDTAGAVQALAASVSGLPDEDPVRRAAAAAVAWTRRN